MDGQFFKARVPRGTVLRRVRRDARLVVAICLLANTASAAIVVDPLSTGATGVSFGTSQPYVLVTNPVADPLNAPAETTVLAIGRSLPGALEINAGSQANLQTIWIGTPVDAPGTLTVRGAGSHLHTSSNVEVGSSGTGTLDILEGATASFYSLDIEKSQAGDKSLFNLSGPGSQLTVQWMYVRKGGLASTALGGLLEARSIDVGFFATGDTIAEAIVDGTDSRWTVDEELVIGETGNGSLKISNGAMVEATATLLGGYAGSTVPLTLAGGTLQTDALYFVPGTIQGTGSVLAKGLVADIALAFDAAHDLVQQIPVAGQPQVMLQLDHSQPGTLGAGFRGSGTLTIADGRIVGSAAGVLGYGTGSFGQAIVHGTGSKWHVAGDLQAGVDGAGELRIGAGASVEVDGELLLGQNTSGPASRVLLDGGELYVNSLSAAASQLLGQGTIHAESVQLDVHLVFDQPGLAPSDLVLDELPGQQVTIDFPSSELGSLGIGYRGEGTLEIRNGAQVHSAGGAVGGAGGSQGMAIVTGAGSEWNVTGGQLVVGANSYPTGEGTLQVVDGGLVEAQTVRLNSNGSIEVAGQNSRIQAASLQISGSSNSPLSSLHVHSGGTLAADNLNAYSSGSSGEILVEGQGSHLYVKYYAVLPGALVRVRSGGELSVGAENGPSRNIDAGTIHLDGGIIDLNGGTLRLQQGQLLFEDGVLRDFRRLEGNLWQTAGRVELSPGQTTVTGAYYQDADATLQVTLEQSSSPERLLVNQSALLNGTLEVLSTSPLPTSASSIFRVLRSQLGIGGTFENYVLPDLAEGLDWSVVQTDTELNLQVIAGDYNQDGVVDAADYTLWRDTRNKQVAKGTGADGNRDGFVNTGDFYIWRDFFGRKVVYNSGSGNAAILCGLDGIDTATVPEPASCLLLLGVLLGAIAMARGCRRPWRVCIGPVH